MRWIAVRASASDAGARDALAVALIGAGAEGVQELDETLLTYLPEQSDMGEVERTVDRLGGDARLSIDELGEVDWSARWTHPDVARQQVGALLVTPPWLVRPDDDPARTITIEPAMAFGTGDHATTRGVLRLMQGVVRKGDRVADLGAGSAILAIAAAKLGAARVAAVELDPDALGNAEENIERNGAGDRVKLLDGDAALLLPLLAPVRVVLANIISSVLVALLPVIRDALAPGGQAILSGLLLTEREMMLDVFRGSGWSVAGEDAEDDWWSVLIEPR